jgi:hypothetical protein
VSTTMKNNTPAHDGIDRVDLVPLPGEVKPPPLWMMLGSQA